MIQDLPVKGHDRLNIKGAMVHRDETLAEITSLVVGRKSSISQIGILQPLIFLCSPSTVSSLFVFLSFICITTLAT